MTLACLANSCSTSAMTLDEASTRQRLPSLGNGSRANAESLGEISHGRKLVPNSECLGAYETAQSRCDSQCTTFIDLISKNIRREFG